MVSVKKNLNRFNRIVTTLLALVGFFTRRGQSCVTNGYLWLWTFGATVKPGLGCCECDEYCVFLRLLPFWSTVRAATIVAIQYSGTAWSRVHT